MKSCWDGLPGRGDRTREATCGRLRVQAPGSACGETWAADNRSGLSLPATTARFGAVTSRGRGGASGPVEPAPEGPVEGVVKGAGRGRLFVVATPIGNLGDVTFRAVEVLKTVPLVAAEDTRLTRRLFARYEIATRLVSYHAQSSRGREAELLEHLRSGRDLALVTDAGTPLVSDPGGELAAAWATDGGVVV